MAEVQKLVSQTVIHKLFGKGIIISADEKYLEVDFAENSKISKFAYPSCFNGFLTLENTELQVEMQAVIETWRVESGEVQKEKLRRQYEKTIQDIEARRIAAEEKKRRAAQRGMERRSIYSNGKQENVKQEKNQYK